jgi:hypothetical protein
MNCLYGNTGRAGVQLLDTGATMPNARIAL